MFSFGMFSSIRSLDANILEHSVCSIFIGECVQSVAVVLNTWFRTTEFKTTATLCTHSPMEMKKAEHSKMLEIKLHMLGNIPKENIRNSCCLFEN
jgi:hypothetical protein